MSLNKIQLIGRVGKDPEGHALQDGTSVVSFTLATSERYRDKNTGEQKESTEWHSITCWRGCADLANNYVRKGQLLYIEGKIHNRSYQDRDGVTRYKTEVIAETIDFLSPRDDKEKQGNVSRPSAANRSPRKTTETTSLLANDLGIVAKLPTN